MARHADHAVVLGDDGAGPSNAGRARTGVTIRRQQLRRPTHSCHFLSENAHIGLNIAAFLSDA
jgi:hypothetical protein